MTKIIPGNFASLLPSSKPRWDCIGNVPPKSDDPNASDILGFETKARGDEQRRIFDELMMRGWLSEDIRAFMDEGKSFADIPPLESALEVSSKNQTSSAGRWFGRSVIYGKEDDHATPYMTRYWIGRLRLHIFHRGDQDPDCHDHPWDFWTFPFTSYVEEVALPNRFDGGHDLHRQIVRAWRLHFRSASWTHRVLGRYSGNVNRRHDHAIIVGVPADYANATSGIEPYYDNRKVVTLVWRSREKRAWGFLKNRDGKWCWVAWRDYVFGGGKSAPCE